MAKNEEFIREYNSKKIIGVLRTDPNGDVKAFAYPSYKILGVYIKAQNITCEFPSYKKVADGNSVVNFIYKK